MGADEMTERFAEVSPPFKARMAGLCYLLMLPTGGLAMFVRGRFVVKGDASATAANILAHETWFRLAFAGDLLVVGVTFLWPPFAAKYFRYLLVLDLGEALLVLWLLVMGVNAERWWEQAGAAEQSRSRRSARADVTQ